MFVSPLTPSAQNNPNVYNSYHDFLFHYPDICCICHCFNNYNIGVFFSKINEANALKWVNLYQTYTNV